PVAYLLLARLLARIKAWREQPGAPLHPAVRVAGLVLVLALVGWMLSVTTALAQPAPVMTPAAQRVVTEPPAGLRLTFHQALERALDANQALKVSQARVAEQQAYVTEARTN